MEQVLGIKEMLKLAIAMEDDGVKYYTTMAEKSDAYYNSMIYKPRRDKVTWSEDKGFYLEVARKVLGENYTNFYHQNPLPNKITHENAQNFYKVLHKNVFEDVKSVLMGMANDEKRHSELFRKWLASVDEETESQAFSPEASEFFAAYSENLTFDLKDNTPATIAEAIKDAIDTEDGAVEFYSGMLEYASPEIAEILKKIVSEEKGHKAKLEAQKAKFDTLMEQ